MHRILVKDMAGKLLLSIDNPVVEDIFSTAEFIHQNALDEDGCPVEVDLIMSPRETLYGRVRVPKSEREFFEDKMNEFLEDDRR